VDVETLTARTRRREFVAERLGELDALDGLGRRQAAAECDADAHGS
jgi:hypothetical protein